MPVWLVTLLACDFSTNPARPTAVAALVDADFDPLSFTETLPGGLAVASWTSDARVAITPQPDTLAGRLECPAGRRPRPAPS